MVPEKGDSASGQPAVSHNFESTSFRRRVFRIVYEQTNHEVQDYFSLSAANKGLEFNIRWHYPIPSLFNNDPTRVKQILINLIANAIKFTDEGGKMIE